jgi:hypothetical protein
LGAAFLFGPSLHQFRVVASANAASGTGPASLAATGLSPSLAEDLSLHFSTAQPAFTFRAGPILRATISKDGRILLVVGGEGPAELISLGPGGQVDWRHSIGVQLSGPSASLFRGTGSGAALCGVGIDEDISRYTVFAPNGAIVLQDTLETPGEQPAIALSPAGDYYYTVWQDQNPLTLTPIQDGKPLSINLPAGASIQKIFVGFVAPTKVLAVRYYNDDTTESYLIDIIRDPMSPVLLQAPEVPRASPELVHAFQAGFGSNGEFIQAVGPEGRISCHAPDGTLLWNLPVATGPDPRVDPIGYLKKCRPEWVVPSVDQPIAAAMGNGCVSIVDVRTGQSLDEKPLPQTMFLMHDACFFEGVLQAAVIGGKGSQQFLFTIKVSSDGNILELSSREAVVCGLAQDRPRLGVVENNKELGCSVIALDKMR